MYDRCSSRIKFCGFTLIELMIVVVIIGILAGIAIPTYTNTREKTFDREAIVALRLMRAANKQYFSKYSHYYPPTGTITSISSINDNLSLDLNTGTWAYSISGSGSAFTAGAVRSGRTWSISQSATDPSCSGTCL